MIKSFSHIAVSVVAGAFIAACTKSEPVQVPPPPPSPEAVAEEQACQAAFDNTLYAINPSDKSPEADALRHAISHTPVEGRMILKGCAAHWARESGQLATQEANYDTCDDLRVILIRLNQIEQTGVPGSEVETLRNEVEGIFAPKCKHVPMTPR